MSDDGWRTPADALPRAVAEIAATVALRGAGISNRGRRGKSPCHFVASVSSGSAAKLSDVVRWPATGFDDPLPIHYRYALRESIPRALREHARHARGVSTALRVVFALRARSWVKPACDDAGMSQNCAHRYNPAFTMRLFMQTQPAGADAPRYYQIVLEQDLLGGWTLFREWGQQGSRASSKREIYLERDAAISAFEHARDAQLKRGFQVMFSQGFDGRHAS